MLDSGAVDPRVLVAGHPRTSRIAGWCLSPLDDGGVIPAALSGRLFLKPLPDQPATRGRPPSAARMPRRDAPPSVANDLFPGGPPRLRPNRTPHPLRPRPEAWTAARSPAGAAAPPHWRRTAASLPSRGQPLHGRGDAEGGAHALATRPPPPVRGGGSPAAPRTPAPHAPAALPGPARWQRPPLRRGEGACAGPLASSCDRDAEALADVCSTHNVRHHPRGRPRARSPPPCQPPAFLGHQRHTCHPPVSSLHPTSPWLTWRSPLSG